MDYLSFVQRLYVFCSLNKSIYLLVLYHFVRSDVRSYGQYCIFFFFFLYMNTVKTGQNSVYSTETLHLHAIIVYYFF